jgi:hypothetical protein
VRCLLAADEQMQHAPSDVTQVGRTAGEELIP